MQQSLTNIGLSNLYNNSIDQDSMSQSFDKLMVNSPKRSADKPERQADKQVMDKMAQIPK